MKVISKLTVWNHWRHDIEEIVVIGKTALYEPNVLLEIHNKNIAPEFGMCSEIEYIQTKLQQ